MEKIKAKFVGLDERLDYLETYNLEIKRNIVEVKKEKKILIIRPYDNLELFFKDWKIIH